VPSPSEVLADPSLYIQSSGCAVDSTAPATLVTEDTVRRFRALFNGRSDAFGVSTLTDKIRADGKLEANSRLEHRPLTEQDIRKHLVGERGVGILPATRDAGEGIFYCCFGVIDIDQYVGFDIVDLARRAAALGKHLVVHRSKSGGAHIYLRVSAEATADSMHDMLRRIADDLGLPADVEIFPKPIDAIDAADPNEYPGGWVNLPYFGDTRPAISSEGRELSLDEYLRYAEARVLPLPAPAEPEPKPLAEQPRRTRRDYENGGAQGNRFNYLKSDLGLYLQKHPDANAEALMAYADYVRSSVFDTKPTNEEWKAWKVSKLVKKLLTREAGKETRADETGWRANLIKSATRVPKGILANAITAFRLCPELACGLRFDSFRQVVVSASPPPWATEPIKRWTDQDSRLAAEFLQHARIEVGEDIAGKAALTVATERAFDPLKDYLRALRWDGVPRIDAWLSTYLGAEDSAYARLIGPKFLIQMAARGLMPGCKADFMLMLRGKQGGGKSAVARALGGEYFSDQLPDVRTKDAAIQLQGVWLMEAAELVAFNNAEDNSIKNFLTINSDRFRPPYGRVSEDFPRRTVIIGTTNQDVFLRDETGERRKWPVAVGKIDLDRVRADRDQLFAEAVARFDEGERWWPVEEEFLLTEKEQDDCFQEDAWSEVVLLWCEDPKPAAIAHGDQQDEPEIKSTRCRVLSGEVLEHAIRKCLATRTRKDDMRVSGILKRAGFKRRRVTIDGAQVWCYCRDEPGQQIEIELRETIPARAVQQEPPPIVWRNETSVSR
jgi:hypothetical protein